ncbi:MAG: phage holin family protein [Thermoleophilia bacterium]|nr:phage holin family protein [Thermoleophilia bacterium]MBJ7333583.1 phage holin family protein [Thermoleophilia bacterium]
MRDMIDRLQEGAYKVSEQAQRLVRAELALAQAEIKAKAQQAAPGIGLIAFAGALAFLALFAIMISIIWAIANLVPLWAAALITAVGFLVLAAVCGLAGKAILKKVGPPTPDTAIGIAKGTPAEFGIGPDAQTKEL